MRLRQYTALVTLLSLRALFSTWATEFPGQRSDNPTEPTQLCKKLSQVRKLPFGDQGGGDRIYNEMVAQGRAVVPCLIDRITDETKMNDPRSEPTYSDFRVGDLAFFLLVRITKVPFEQMLPGSVQAKLKDQGVYAYFEYIQKRENRKVLQSKWKLWLKQQS